MELIMHGYGEIMTEAREHLPGAGESGDVARIVSALHRAGPLRLSDLGREPELVGWSAQRIERAVVGAWSRNLISFDRSDMLVAL